MANEVEKKIKEKLGIGAVMTDELGDDVLPAPLTSESDEATSAKRGEQAHALCLRLLTARARTRAELAGRLTQRGYPDEVIDGVLGRLEAVGLIDDEDFAAQWVRARQTHAGKGKAGPGG